MTVTKAGFLITEADSKLLLNFKQLTCIQLKDNIQLCICAGDTRRMRKILSVSLTGVMRNIMDLSQCNLKDVRIRCGDTLASRDATFLLHQIIYCRWVSFDRGFTISSSQYDETYKICANLSFYKNMMQNTVQQPSSGNPSLSNSKRPGFRFGWGWC